MLNKRKLLKSSPKTRTGAETKEKDLSEIKRGKNKAEAAI
jgi:hypothetical protein